MKVKNMINSRGNTVANQFIIKDDIYISFQSYRSLIATFKYDLVTPLKLKLSGNMWDYSATTRKYFKQFINEETPFTYETKAQWLKEIENNPKIEVV